MYYKLTGILRSSLEAKWRARAERLIVALALALLIPATACAYTVVMRGGRRIEIPNTFIVTTKTLTYEAAPGVQITLMMTAIDIAATERANNEPAGSLLRRAQMVAPVSTTDRNTAAPQARRTLTNKDLEASRRAREESERAYERRRIELGLPSLEETRRRNAEESARARAVLQQSERDEAQAEGYWRARANSLRTEMAALDAEINYLRGRLAEETDVVGVPFTSVTTVLPTFPFGRVGVPFNQSVLTGNPGFIRANNAGLRVAGHVGFGGRHRTRALLNINTGVSLVAPPVIVGGSVFVPPLQTYSAGPLSNFYYPSYERSALIVRLREVEATRAGLQARWRLLEDEARRAGALPGWLRP